MRGLAANGFAEVMAPELGERLTLGLASCADDPAPEAEPLRGLLRELGGWEQKDRHERSVWVARAMRICATLSTAGAGEVKRPSRSSRPPAQAAAARAASQPVAAAKPQVEATKSVPSSPEAPPATVVLQPAMSVRELPGVGPATADKLIARGLSTVVDLAYLLPLGYHDRRIRKPLHEIEDGEVVVIEGRVLDVQQNFGRGRFMASMRIAVEGDDEAGSDEGGTQVVTARWFHRIGGLQRFTPGSEVVASGPMRRYRGAPSMAHPDVQPAGEPGPSISIRYPQVEGVPPRTLARIVRAALERLPDPRSGFIDALPEDIVREVKLPSQLRALQHLHTPPEDLPPEAFERLSTGRSRAHLRLSFDEFFFVQLALLRRRAEFREHRIDSLITDDACDLERWCAALPFQPTGAQSRVLREVYDDLLAPTPMLRLLQGDVGSGKTAVAFGAVLATTASGGQAALMAPTEILAEQHFRTLSPWCERAGLRVALLTGNTPKAQRNSLLALLAAGQIDLLIGTHALLVGDVDFAALRLVVIDEQHRFGVEQRALLRDKGETPHLLVMTATPIPRTLALCAYGELDVSVIDELPPGRTPVVTDLYTGKRGLTTARRILAQRVASGERAFVVCPLVEASDAIDVTDVEATASAIADLLPGVTVGVVHGRMKSRDKDLVMEAFRRGDTKVLVATTVIEVGVDVPEATVMLVEHAERFGLAQLHQLRGRVGRGGGQAWCLLHTAHASGSDSAKRLSVLTETTDGFKVAEHDLEQRGPGEIFGTRQAGLPALRFAGFAGEGTKLLVSAREAAAKLLARDPRLVAHPVVRTELERRCGPGAIVGAESG